MRNKLLGLAVVVVGVVATLAYALHALAQLKQGMGV